MSFVSPAFRAYGLSLIQEDAKNDILGTQFQNPYLPTLLQKPPNIQNPDNSKPIVENEESKDNEKKINSINIPDAIITNRWDEEVSQEFGEEYGQEEFENEHEEDTRKERNGSQHIRGDFKKSKFNPKRSAEPTPPERDPRPDEFTEIKVESDKPDVIANSTANQSTSRPFNEPQDLTQQFKLTSSENINQIKSSLRSKKSRNKKQNRRNQTTNYY